MSEWQDLYRRYTKLSTEWAVHDHPGVNEQLFARAVRSASEVEAKAEFASFGVSLPPLWDEAREIHRLMQFPTRGREGDDPCADVYQAALTMMPGGVWTPSPDHQQLYRGQRDARWPVVPSVFRVDAQGRDESLARVSGLGAAVLAERADLSPDQALALIQHYSAELDAPTWLLDLTWDPRVALLFASLGGVTGEIGIITMLVRAEWEAFSAGGRNQLGEIRVIEVPDVLRIERQRALFLDTSHPDLLEQYVAHSVWFRQVEGLVFEDPDADWPVTRTACFPEADPTLEMVRQLTAKPGPRFAAPWDASRDLDADEYLAIALSWCEEDGVELEPRYADVLKAVCRVHSALQVNGTMVDITLRSLHRLRQATERIVDHQRDGRAIDVRSALDLTFMRSMADDERIALERLVADAESAMVERVRAERAKASSVLEKVSELLDDLPPSLTQLLAIGVRDVPEGRVARDIEAALDDPRCRVFDLRGAGDRNGIAALATESDEAVRMLLVDSDTAQDWLAPLVRAVLDDRDRIVYAEGWIARTPGQTVVVVHYGAADITELLPVLVDILVVQFI